MEFKKLEVEFDGKLANFYLHSVQVERDEDGEIEEIEFKIYIYPFSDNNNHQKFSVYLTPDSDSDDGFEINEYYGDNRFVLSLLEYTALEDDDFRELLNQFTNTLMKYV